LEAVDSCGIVFPVSVWMKKLTWEEEPRCIAVMEPVERKTAMVLFDAEVCNLKWREMAHDNKKEVEGNHHVNSLTTIMHVRVGGRFCSPVVQC